MRVKRPFPSLTNVTYFGPDVNTCYKCNPKGGGRFRACSDAC